MMFSEIFPTKALTLCDALSWIYSQVLGSGTGRNGKIGGILFHTSSPPGTQKNISPNSPPENEE